MTTTQCVICTRDSPHAYVCDECVTNLAAGLRTLAWLAAELMVTYTRQDRLASGHSGSSPNSPLGYNIAASHTYTALRTMLANRTRWADLPPTATPAAMVRCLIEHIDHYRNDPHADLLAKDIEHHTKAALEIINPLDPNEQTYGVCGAERRDGTTCTAYLYGAPKADWVRCKHCQTQHDTRRRIQQLEQRMRVLYFRAATLARLLPRLIERPVSASNIRNWFADGRPIKTKLDEQGVITYHAGDVISVATRTPKRDRAAKKAGSAA